MTSNDHASVGYGKPPTQHQFKRGRSGNPTGRRKGSKNFRTILAEVLRRRITITLDGQSIRLAIIDALVLVLVHHATSGSIRHIKLLWQIDSLERSKPLVICFERGDEKI